MEEVSKRRSRRRGGRCTEVRGRKSRCAGNQGSEEVRTRRGIKSGKGQDPEVGAPLSWPKLVRTVQHPQPWQARLRAQVLVRSDGSPLTAPSPAQRPLHFPTPSPSPSISHKMSAIPGALPGQGRVSGSSLGPGSREGRGPSAEWALSLHPQT